MQLGTPNYINKFTTKLQLDEETQHKFIQGDTSMHHIPTKRLSTKTYN